MSKTIEALRSGIMSGTAPIGPNAERRLEGLIEALSKRVEALEAAYTCPKAPAQGWTIKRMAAEMGRMKDEALRGVLRSFAQKYCRENNLNISKTLMGARKYEYFPKQARDYAIEKVKELGL